MAEELGIYEYLTIDGTDLAFMPECLGFDISESAVDVQTGGDSYRFNPQLLAGLPDPTVEDVLLQQREERLHGGVVAGGTNPAHRPDQTVAVELVDQLSGPELLGFNQSMQHRDVEGSVVAPRRPQRVSSTRGPCVVCC